MKTFLIPFLALCLTASAAVAGDPLIWTVSSRPDVLKGDSRGIAIDQNGTLSLSPRFVEIFKTGQPFVWSSTIDRSGNVFLGTGGEGRIFRVAPNGTGSLFADLSELNVTALAIGSNNELFAATSPDGKVYRINASGQAEVYFEPKEKYIWSLAVFADGSLAVGTGDNGKVFRVRSAGLAPTASLFYDTSETHIIALAADQLGNLYAGTDPGGLVLRFASDGKPFALLDSPLRELHELAFGPDGSIYALALGESVSTASPSPTPTPESRTVAIEKPKPAQPEQPPKSRYDLTGARSAVYRILPDGGSDILWSSATVTGFSLYAHQTGNGVLLGTSDKGRIYSIGNDGGERLVLQSDAGQISTIRSVGPRLYATSSNQGSLFTIGPETVAEGVYESAVLDSKTSAAWGRAWWRSSGNVAVETRSGNTEVPGETWSSWEAVRGANNSGRIGSPGARFLQWRVVLKSAAAPPGFRELSLAFMPRNAAPEVHTISVLPANIGLAPNPPVQLDPNIEVSGMDPALFGIMIQTPPPRRVYQRGAQAFQWTAEDRNGDRLVYDIYIREVSEADYKLLRQNHTESFFTLDGLGFADGRYTVRIVARDSPSNASGLALSGERTSEPFDIDNTQPMVTVVGTPQAIGGQVRTVFLATDRSSYIVRAEYSVNGGEWLAAVAEDGISDSPEERFVVQLPIATGLERSVTLRVFDAAGNIGTARAVVGI